MAQIRLTLQNRITTLVVTSSLLLIAAFTVMQLNNQLGNLTRFNSYQASLASTIAKNNLEAILRKSAPADVPKALQTGVLALRDSGVVSDATVFDKEGKIIAATDTATVSGMVRFRDIDKWETLTSATSKWYVSEIDPIKRRLNIYIGLRHGTQDTIAYLNKISFSLGNIGEAFSGVYQTVLLATFLILVANIIMAYVLSKTVIGPVKMLNEVTKIIAGGDLSIRTNIKTNDELEELGRTFNSMAEALIQMKERAENANPLTKLPGNMVIHEQIDRRIALKQKFVVIYADLDNFKSFNDKYGIAKGDEAIKLTAEIMKEAIKSLGNGSDFIGHEGGDDFILLTSPDRAQLVADYMIGEFNKRIRQLYNQEDLNQGFIISTARDGTIKNFPIMTISLAGVTNEHRPISSYGEVTNIAAEVKKKAKTHQMSIFVMDKRHS